MTPMPKLIRYNVVPMVAGADPSWEFQAAPDGRFLFADSALERIAALEAKIEPGTIEKVNKSSQQIWILEQRRVPDGEWEPCTGSVIRLRPQDFDKEMFKRESYSRYEFRASPYRRSLQPPLPVAQGPLKAPKPPRDRGVR